MSARGAVRRPRRAPPSEWWPAGDAQATSSRVALKTGITVRIIAAGPAAGAPIVLVHGWGIHSYLWRRNIGALAASGRRVYAVDLPGHGLSDRPLAPGSYTLAALTAQLAAVFDALGVRRAPVVAQSMGGRVAVELARTYADRVSGLALFGSVGFGDVFPFARLVARLVARLPVPRGKLATMLARRWMVAMSRSFAYGTRAAQAPEDVDAYWATTQFPDFLAAMRQALMEFDWQPLTPPVLAGIAQPVLVVFGTRDRMVRPVRAESLVRAMPRGRLHWVKDAGHVANEEAPEEVNPLLVEFAQSIG